MFRSSPWCQRGSLPWRRSRSLPPGSPSALPVVPRPPSAMPATVMSSACRVAALHQHSRRRSQECLAGAEQARQRQVGAGRDRLPLSGREGGGGGKGPRRTKHILNFNHGAGSPRHARPRPPRYSNFWSNLETTFFTATCRAAAAGYCGSDPQAFPAGNHRRVPPATRPGVT